MRKIAVIVITMLLLVVICLQILSALNIFPKQERVDVCPVGAISMQGGKAVIDKTKCIGCRRCVDGVAASIPAVVDATTSIDPSPRAEKSNPLAINRPTATNSPPSTNTSSTAKKAPTAQTEASEAKHRVDPAKCIGCGLCTIYCPEGAISMEGNKAVIDPAKCINCGICKNGNNAEFKGCPVKAISAP